MITFFAKGGIIAAAIAGIIAIIGATVSGIFWAVSRYANKER